MIVHNDVKEIKLYSTFKEFCKNQEDCINCDLLKKDLINDAYDQPCEQVYDLLKTIEKMFFNF